MYVFNIYLGNKKRPVRTQKNSNFHKKNISEVIA